MRAASAILLGALVASWGPAFSAEKAPGACHAATGTFLTIDVNSDNGRTVGRSLVSLTDGGQIFVTGSNQGGAGEFAPFTEARGAWRCVSDADGRAHIRATVIDFTEVTARFPDPKLARLDYDATVDETSGRLRADVLLYFVPLDANPMDEAALRNPIRNRVTGTRVTAP